MDGMSPSDLAPSPPLALLQQEHERSLAFSALHQKIYVDYRTYVADQDAFLLRHRHTTCEIDDAFPCPDRDVVRTFAAYQQRRTEFLHSSALRSETAALGDSMDEWIAFSAGVSYTFSLYLAIREHELLIIRHFLRPHTMATLPPPHT